MKRCSLYVSEGLKESGYPQCPNTAHYMSGIFMDFPEFYCEDYENLCAAPFVIEAMIWLWEKKNIKIEVSNNDEWYIWPLGVKGNANSDKYEDIVESALEYLIENKLIK